jgi:hypothetical protein
MLEGELCLVHRACRFIFLDDGLSVAGATGRLRLIRKEHCEIASKLAAGT